MSFLNNPENNWIKVAVLLIVIALCGYFVYSEMHNNSLGGLGKVLNAGSSTLTPSGTGSSGGGTSGGMTTTTGTGTTAPGTSAGTTTTAATTGTGTASGTTTVGSTTSGVNASGTTKGGTSKGGTTGTDPVCDRTSTAPIVLILSAGAATTPTSVTTSTGGVVGGQWLNFNLTNPGTCPVVVTKMQYVLTTTFTGSAWPIIQNISVMDNTTSTQFGPSLHPESTPTPLAPMTFLDSTGVVINPGMTHNFTLLSDSRNIPRTPSGGNYQFRLRLSEFYSTNVITSVGSNQTAPPTTPVIITPVIHVYP